MLKLTNSLGKKKEEFISIKPHTVGMYNCGPTVYDYVHIGNLRAYVFADILRRALEFTGYQVNQIMNITDIGHLSGDGDEGEDKMTKGLKREGKPLTLEAMRELSDFYTEKFEQDIEALNIKPPHKLPRASDHIKEEIELIQKLEKKKFIYTTSDGIYFDTSKDATYGRLGSLTPLEDEKARIENSEKKNPRDFALWKFNNTLGYESPWGKGFPGWHLECSAMSMKYLGETFDIHTGGVDHIPVHHNNEIAQSENVTGKPYAMFWLHNAFVTIDGDKMAKSERNFFRLKDVEEKGISPLSYRYWLLGARYSTPMNFSWDAMAGAHNAYQKLLERMSDLGDKTGSADKKYIQKFTEAIHNDLDTPAALALIWELLGDELIPNADKKATIAEFDQVLGLKLIVEAQEIPGDVKKLVALREAARHIKDWQKADELRLEIENKGYKVKDTEAGPKIMKLSTG